MGRLLVYFSASTNAAVKIRLATASEITIGLVHPKRSLPNSSANMKVDIAPAKRPNPA